MTEPEKDLIHTLAAILDTCLDHLDAMATRESTRERYKPMRNITHKLLAEAAHKAVAEALELLGMER
jgi:hypothetical protein